MSEDALLVSHDEFLGSEERLSDLGDLIATCLARRTALRVAVGADAVSIAGEEVEGPATIRLSGVWRVPGIGADRSLETGERLLLPTLFAPTELCLPQEALFTLDLERGSIASFCARNLFAALLMDLPTRWEEIDGDPPGERVSQMLRSNYLRVLQARISETFFETVSTEDALGLLEANSYAPLVSFESAVLEIGSQALRRSREPGAAFEDPDVRSRERAYFARRISGAKSLLEFGPSVGRLFGLDASLERVATVDISTLHRDRACQAAEKAGVTVEGRDIAAPDPALPFDAWEFDMAVAGHVLMHIPFESIEHAMWELARVARRVVVVSVWHRHWARAGADFDRKWRLFAHDYEGLCRRLGLTYGDHELFTETPDQRAFGFTFARPEA